MISPSTAPLLIFSTRHGSLYNLTPTNIPALIPALQLSYGDLHDYVNTLSNLPEGMSIKKFFGFSPNTLTYLTPYDFFKKDCMTGCQNNSKVKIKCNKGYTEVTAELYDSMIDIIKPDIFVGLTEYPSLEKDHSSESNKSHKRAINKTKTYLEKSKKFQKRQEGQDKPIRLAAVHGGKNISLINRSLEQVLDHPIDGIVVCDFCESETLEEREEAYNTILRRLQQEYKWDKSPFFGRKLKMCLAGPGKIEDIEHAMKFGFDMFEVSYPFTVAQSLKALTIKNGIVTVRDPVRKEDLSPLEQNCQCHSCVNHSETYIFHLIECYELTGKILLSIHNMHIYQQWLASFTAKE